MCAREYTNTRANKDVMGMKIWWCVVTQSVDKNENYGIDLVEN